MAEIIRLSSADTPTLLQRCRAVLAAGELLILPTDTVYGLVARADDRRAVGAVFAVKGRNTAKPLVVMVPGVEEALALAVPEQREPLRLLAVFWPGPLTLVVRPVDAPWIQHVSPASPSLGLRVPDDPFLLRLLTVVSPLAVTSANTAGGSSPTAFSEIAAGLLDAAGLAVDGGSRGSGRASTVAEIRGDTVAVLRQGEITEEELVQSLTRGGEARPTPRSFSR